MRALLLLFLLTVLLACGRSYVYEENQTIADSGWAYDEPAAFAFNIADTNQLYNLYLFVAHTTAFSSQNFYVKIETTFPSGETLEEEVSIQLADKFGQWFGDCSNQDCMLEIPLQQEAFFNQAGDYRISIAQFTRDNPLKGINSVGFGLEALGRK